VFKRGGKAITRFLAITQILLSHAVVVVDDRMPMDSTPLFEAILEGMFGEGNHKNQGDPSLSHGEFRPEAALC